MAAAKTDDTPRRKPTQRDGKKKKDDYRRCRCRDQEPSSKLGEQADEIRGENYLTVGLLDKLRPLLEEPIPPAFIETIGTTKGKPYESTGVRSVQVQIDRLNRVLGLSNWRDNYSYEDDGRLCHVIISVLGAPNEEGNREVLCQRSSYGGVDHGSTRGNIHKGSYTNAAKLAIARLGPGHEIYCGVPDMDPDVSKDLASGAPPKAEKKEPDKVAAAQVEQLRKLWRQSGVDEKAWKTFLASRKKMDVAAFDNDDFQAAVSFLAESGESEEEGS